ncbi:hypothetical protein HanRHA438_Chr08g0357661 [Helianthus annuus]|nr:hypothetical protein HanRHA438_Chr08g0357661 [Helianthus annuus]
MQPNPMPIVKVSIYIGSKGSRSSCSVRASITCFNCIDFSFLASDLYLIF